MTISAWDSFAVSEKWTMDDNNLLKLLFFVLFFFFLQFTMKACVFVYKSGRLLLWAADLSRNTKKRQIKSFSTELRFTFHWLLNSSEVLSVWWENVWWAYLRSEKKKPSQCVYPKSLSSVSVRDSFLVTLTDVCSHKSCFIKRFFFFVHCVLIVNI